MALYDEEVIQNLEGIKQNTNSLAQALRTSALQKFSPVLKSSVFTPENVRLALILTAMIALAYVVLNHKSKDQRK